MPQFLCCSIMTKKPHFLRDRQTSGTCTCIHIYRPVTTSYRQMDDSGREAKNLNLGSVLIKLFQGGSTLFSFLNVTSMRCGASEIIFNVLTDTSAFVCYVPEIFQRPSVVPTMVPHCQGHAVGFRISVPNPLEAPSQWGRREGYYIPSGVESESNWDKTLMLMKWAPITLTEALRCGCQLENNNSNSSC